MSEIPKTETSVFSRKTSVRRRTCVICGQSTPNSYVTSFTRIPEKQEEWVINLANGDVGYAEELKKRLDTGRKYLCLDHFDRKHLVDRKSGDGKEVIRKSLPIAYKNVQFVRHDSFKDVPSTSTFKDIPSTSTSEDPPIPAKRRKMLNSLKGKGAVLDSTSMAFMMETINFHVNMVMQEADEALKTDDMD